MPVKIVYLNIIHVCPVCDAIKNDPSKHPDVILDLTMFTVNRCLLRYLARQLDTGLMTTDPVECPTFQLTPTATQPSHITATIGVPSVRFPGCAVEAALSAFSGQLLRTINSDTVFVTDEVLGPNSLFSDFGKLEFVGRYFVKLDSPIDVKELYELFTKLHKIVQSDLWTVKIRSSTMKTILSTIRDRPIIAEQLHTDWLIYDGSLNMNTCELLCYQDDEGKRRCGIANAQRTFYCLKHDLKEADHEALGRVKVAVGQNWSRADVDQMRIVFAYEAVKTAVLAFNQVKLNNQWPPALTSMNESLCDVSPPTLTTNTRYYRFANAVRKDATYNYRLNAIKNQEKLPSLGKRHVLRVLVIPDPPFVIKTENGWTGYSIEVFRDIARALELQYNFSEQMDHNYGVKLPDGKWNGIIGQIASKHADVGLGPVIQDGERKMVVDFTIPYYDSAGLIMLVSTKTDQELGPFFFLEVFTTPVWLCCLLAVGTVSFLVYLLDRLSPYSFQNQAVLHGGPSEGTLFTLKESIWYVLGACTQQGESLDPRSTSTRILITGHWIFVVIMVSMFSANLSARLTVSGLKEEIKSLEQLVEQTDVKYTVQSNSAEYAFFRKMYEVEESLFKVWRELSVNLTEASSNYSVWQYPITERYGILFKRMSKWGFTNDTEDSLRRLRNGWVIFMESPLAAYHISTSCDLRQLGERIGSWHYGIALPPKSFLTPRLNSMILRLKAENTLDILEKKWWSTNTSNCPETTSTTGFGMEQVGGMFILLACGFVAGVIILGIELLVYRVIMKRATNKVGDSSATPGFDDKETKSATATTTHNCPGHENKSTVLTPATTTIVISRVESESPPPPSYEQSQS
ncbi:Ligand-gated ion channel [Paragonimus heterotremus]|uniref:Ligand-gated ion channel n=1 Tax=Paragonimus heterotremus TaxID=100268 RepID=A0A8J4WV80_9TREM|nr:Ligand-gated ion channel [Paragonimus heterotremus]